MKTVIGTYREDQGGWPFFEEEETGKVYYLGPSVSLRGLVRYDGYPDEVPVRYRAYVDTTDTIISMEKL
jgi:hypothetical protein